MFQHTAPTLLVSLVTLTAHVCGYLSTKCNTLAAGVVFCNTIERGRHVCDGMQHTALDGTPRYVVVAHLFAGDAPVRRLRSRSREAKRAHSAITFARFSWCGYPRLRGFVIVQQSTWATSGVPALVIAEVPRGKQDHHRDVPSLQRHR